MDADILICSAVGIISSKVKTFKQKNDLYLVRFRLSVPSSEEKITVKFFDVDESAALKITSTFSYGDKIKAVGDVQCDVYTAKEKLFKGICIIPTQIELLEKGVLTQLQDIQIIDRTSTIA